MGGTRYLCDHAGNADPWSLKTLTARPPMTVHESPDVHGAVPLLPRGAAWGQWDVPAYLGVCASGESYASSYRGATSPILPFQFLRTEQATGACVTDCAFGMECAGYLHL